MKWSPPIVGHQQAFYLRGRRNGVTSLAGMREEEDTMSTPRQRISIQSHAHAGNVRRFGVNIVDEGEIHVISGGMKGLASRIRLYSRNAMGAETVMCAFEKRSSAGQTDLLQLEQFTY